LQKNHLECGWQLKVLKSTQKALAIDEFVLCLDFLAFMPHSMWSTGATLLMVGHFSRARHLT
jgi:hypothetical protein